MRSLLAVAAVLTVACAPPTHNRRQLVDGQLAQEIDSIKAIDNHAHPVRVVNPGEKDTEFDALPVEMMESYDTAPLRMRPDNPEFKVAAASLFRREGLAAKQQMMKDKGEGYPAWVLDELGIAVMLANRTTMGRGLPSTRFKWVPYGDALMYPFNNENLSKRDPDRRAFFAAEEKLLRRYLTEAGVNVVPQTLDDYLRFITSTLVNWREKGAVAVKLEMAYLRALDVGNPGKAEAERVYALATENGPLSDSDYKAFQDFMFRYLALECGRLKMALHFHSSAGAGRYFDVAGVNPMLLIPVIVDGAMRGTNFVFVHGAWPFTREMTALLDKPNVYLDFSAQTYLLYPQALAANLRGWLEYAPEKVMFGTDASPVTDQVNWEETGWIATNTGREALTIALTGMMRDNEITRERAVQLARMVLRENAGRLYGIK